MFQSLPLGLVKGQKRASKFIMIMHRIKIEFIRNAVARTCQNNGGDKRMIRSLKFPFSFPPPPGSTRLTTRREKGVNGDFDL